MRQLPFKVKAGHSGRQRRVPVAQPFVERKIRDLVDSCHSTGLAGARQKPPQGPCVKPMWTSYGGWARSGGLGEAHDLTAVLTRLERWTLPLAIALLFAYPSPLVWLGLVFVVAPRPLPVS